MEGGYVDGGCLEGGCLERAIWTGLRGGGQLDGPTWRGSV